jgi:archaemetzincin
VILGVTEEDLFAGRLNFIFGIASPARALISLRRLRPEFHGFGDERLFRLRALKEAVHELGHAFGLPHCPERTCVMAFSSSILDTDMKDWRYCPRCRARLEGAGVRVQM